VRPGRSANPIRIGMPMVVSRRADQQVLGQLQSTRSGEATTEACLVLGSNQASNRFGIPGRGWPGLQRSSIWAPQALSSSSPVSRRSTGDQMGWTCRFEILPSDVQTPWRWEATERLAGIDHPAGEPRRGSRHSAASKGAGEGNRKHQNGQGRQESGQERRASARMTIGRAGLTSVCFTRRLSRWRI